MLSFDEARARVLEGAGRVGVERVTLADAAFRVLRETLRATAPLPPFDYSAMDGYAVATADLRGVPWTLPVVGESRTGHDAPVLREGTAMRIFTGAALPLGADAVVMQEQVEREADLARSSAVPRAGAHVRRAGEDLGVGDEALTEGTRLTPGSLSLAASLDRGTLLVSARPRVTILCTGDELRQPGSAPRPGSIPESNSVALAAFARRVGAQVEVLPIVGDDRERTQGAVTAALESSDVLLTVGGVSVGDHDVVRPALEAAGAELDFYKVRIKPGKPLTFGKAKDTLILGLPGNPVSALVTFVLFGAPLLRVMQGDARPLPRPRVERLLAEVRQTPGRRNFLRARLTDEGVMPLTNQSSGAPTSIAWADALIDVDETVEHLAIGSSVPVIELEQV